MVTPRASERETREWETDRATNRGFRIAGATINVAPAMRKPRFVARIAGATINVGVDPSKVLITKLHMDKDRKALLARKGGAKGTDAADAMQTVS